MRYYIEAKPDKQLHGHTSGKKVQPNGSAAVVQVFQFSKKKNRDDCLISTL